MSLPLLLIYVRRRPGDKTAIVCQRRMSAVRLVMRLPASGSSSSSGHASAEAAAGEAASAAEAAASARRNDHYRRLTAGNGVGTVVLESAAAAGVYLHSLPLAADCGGHHHAVGRQNACAGMTAGAHGVGRLIVDVGEVAVPSGRAPASSCG